MSAIVGTYEMVSSEKYDEFLKAVGVGTINRTLASKASPTMTWTESGGKWSQKVKTTIKSFEINFTLDTEFDEQLADGRNCKSVISIEGNTLTHKQRIGDLNALVIRVFNGDEMVTTFQSGDVVAKRVFKKVK